MGAGASSAPSPEAAGAGKSDPQEPAKGGDASSNVATTFTVLPPLANCLVIFDNKAGVENKPRVGVVRGGVVTTVLEGDSSVLKADDLESVSLIRPEEALYVGVTSLGACHIFILQEKAQKNGSSTFSAKHVSQGQLPVPEGEATDIWSNPNRTNIEAARCFGVLPPSVQKDQYAGEAPIMVWGARGGRDYAGVSGPCESVWLRWAPFDPTTGKVDEANMTESSIKNLGDDGSWRALSSLDMDDEFLYFTAAFDGEEEGINIKEDDAARTSSQNRKAFCSLVARKHIVSGETVVLGRFEVCKSICSF